MAKLDPNDYEYIGNTGKDQSQSGSKYDPNNYDLTGNTQRPAEQQDYYSKNPEQQTEFLRQQAEQELPSSLQTIDKGLEQAGQSLAPYVPETVSDTAKNIFDPLLGATGRASVRDFASGLSQYFLNKDIPKFPYQDEIVKEAIKKHPILGKMADDLPNIALGAFQPELKAAPFIEQLASDAFGQGLISTATAKGRKSSSPLIAGIESGVGTAVLGTIFKGLQLSPELTEFLLNKYRGSVKDIEKVVRNAKLFQELNIPTTKGTLTQNIGDLEKEQNLLQGAKNEDIRNRKFLEAKGVKTKLTDLKEQGPQEQKDIGEFVKKAEKKRLEDLRGRRNSKYAQAYELGEQSKPIPLNNENVINKADELIKNARDYGQQNFQDAVNSIVRGDYSQAEELQKLLTDNGLINQPTASSSALNVLNQPLAVEGSGHQQQRAERETAKLQQDYQKQFDEILEQYQKAKEQDETVIQREGRIRIEKAIEKRGKRYKREMENMLQYFRKSKGASYEKESNAGGFPEVPTNNNRAKQLTQDYEQDIQRLLEQKNALEKTGFSDVPENYYEQQAKSKILDLTHQFQQKHAQINQTALSGTKVKPATILPAKKTRNKIMVHQAESFRKALNRIYASDKQNQATRPLIHIIKQALDEEFDRTLKAPENKKANPKLINMLKQGRKLQQVISTEFDEKGLVGELLQMKGQDTPKIENSKVFNKVMDAPIEQYQKVINTLKRSGADGEKAIIGLKNGFLDRLIKNSFNQVRNEDEEALNQNPLDEDLYLHFKPKMFLNTLDKVGDKKIALLYRNKKTALELLKKVRHAATLLYRDPDIIHKGSAPQNQGNIERATEFLMAGFGGLIGYEQVGFHGGLIGSYLTHFFFKLAKKIHQGQTIKQILENDPKAYKEYVKIKTKIPSIERIFRI